MAPPAYSTGFHFDKGVARRTESGSCSGWDCLGEATQTGILLVVFSSVAVLGYLYWRFKIKPNRQHGRASTITTGQWEVTRRSPNTVSITLYREPRPASDQEAGRTDNRTPARVRRKKGDNKSTQTGENQFNQTTAQAGAACVPQSHLLPPPLPPPPAPIFWPAAAPSIIPPPPPLGHPVPWPSAPHPVPQYTVPVGPGLATAPYPPDVPPPYFNHQASQNFERYDPKPRHDETAGPAWTPQPNPWPSPPRGNQERMRPAAPPTRNQRQWRRWFSWGGRPRIPGHTTTLSNSSFTSTRSRSPSPPPHPGSLEADGRARGHLRGSPSRTARQSSVNHLRTPENATRTLRQNQPVREQRSHLFSPESQSEVSYGSSYINSSSEAVCNPSSSPEPRHRVNRQPSRERRSYRSRGPAPRRAPSDSITLSPLPRQRSLSARPRRVEPSPDLQFPPPERRRARVSFERVTDSDRTSFTPSPRERDSAARRHSATRYARRDGLEHANRRRSQARREKEPAPLLVEVFRLVRHALRGDY
jgi:hypothetical protein